MWIRSFICRERRKSYLLFCVCHGLWALRILSLVQLLACICGGYILVHLTLNLSSSLQPVSFELYQHFLLHQMTELISHLIILLLKYYVIVPKLLQIKIQFLLLLLNPLMMHLIKVSLFQKFIISTSGFLGNYDCFV